MYMSVLLLLALLAARLQAALNPIVIEGTKFFDSVTGDQFYFKGIAYQESLVGLYGSTTFIDPLADSSGCQRDIPYLTQLGVNLVHVYAITPSLSHDDCMEQLDKAGIYVLCSLDAPGILIDQDDPQWNNTLYNRFTNVVDAMQTYNNTIGFLANADADMSTDQSAQATDIKAAIRDTKTYIQGMGYRAIPVGVGFADSEDDMVPTDFEYMNCGPTSEAADFVGLNDYSWCGNSSYSLSDYHEVTTNLSSLSIPAILSEFGCVSSGNYSRPFTEIHALYGPQMTSVFSGGIAYEYFNADDQEGYGMVTVNGDSASPNQDYSNLQSQLSKISPSTQQLSAYTATSSAPACPSDGTSYNLNTVLPTPPSLARVAQSSFSSEATATATDLASTTSSTGKPAGSNGYGYTSSHHSSSTAIGVGVGVGVGVFLILAALGIFFWMRRRRRSREQNNPFNAPPIAGANNHPEIQEVPGSDARAELAEQPEGMSPQELVGEHYAPKQRQPPENAERFELPATVAKTDDRYA